MKPRDASEVICVKVRTCNHLVQSQICFLTVMSFIKLMLTMRQQLMVSVRFLSEPGDLLGQLSRHDLSIELFCCCIYHKWDHHLALTSTYPCKQTNRQH